MFLYLTRREYRNKESNGEKFYLFKTLKLFTLSGPKILDLRYFFTLNFHK